MNIRLLSLSCAFFGVAGSSYAQTWTGTAGTGAWATTSNWNNNALPATTNIVTFDGANANSQFNINLGANRTVAGVVFINAVGTNPFTFSNNTLTIGSSGIVNNDADTQIFNSGVTLNASQTWNAASGGLSIGGALNVGANTLTVGGSFDTAFSSTVSGNGTITKQGSGALNWTGGGGFNGTFNMQAGTVTFNKSGNFSLGFGLTQTGGTFNIESGGNFGGFSANASIDGGALLKITPGGTISGLSGTITFGTTGGTIDLNGALASGANIGTIVVNTTSGFSTIKYGTIANSVSGALGWDTSGTDLTIASGDLSGSGNLSFNLTGGALLTLGNAGFSGAMNFTGVSGGDASAGSGSTSVGRLMINTPTATFSNGLTFDNAMQVSATGGNRTIDSDITINSGTTAFQGESRNGSARSLTLGTSVGVYNLTVKDGATAVLDVRYRDDSGMNQVGNLVLKNNTVLEAGGTLSLTKSATVASETVGNISVFGNITGQGTTAKESTLSLNTTRFSFDSGSSLIVNGSDFGGLRVQGSSANVSNVLTSARMQGLTGSGGTLTVAYTDSATGNFSAAPTTGSNVSLGFDAQGGSSPTYRLGASNNDLANWGGLVIKGGSVQLMKDESLTGSVGVTTALNLLGGTLTLNDGLSAHTLTVEGGANLTAGTLNGSSGLSGSGTLVIGGDLTHGTATLTGSPNITMNVSGANQISGSAITGVGTLTKTGVGTVTLNTSLTANTIDIQNGTLLLGGANLIGNSTAIKLSGGTFGTAGYNETVGTLTLSAGSTIDLGAGNSSVLNFANSSGISWSGTLYITNWSGSWVGGGGDELMFGSAVGGLTAGQVGNIIFVNPNGSVGTFNARILGTGEIVPVPEPATIGFGALLLSGLSLRERERLRRFFSALRAKFVRA